MSCSRLIEADEAGTLARQKRHRAELIDPEIAAHHWRIVKVTGDGMIAELPSVVVAVHCAVSVQREREAREAGFPEEHEIICSTGEAFLEQISGTSSCDDTSDRRIAG